MTGEEIAAQIHRYSWTAVKPGLERISALLRQLGGPQSGLRFIHIAGSNGKGSTAAMLAAILQQAGYRTGLFTSPHLYRFNERIQINGICISDAELEQIADEVLAAGAYCEVHPTEFDLMTAIGLLYFARQNCQVVVLEVGLGGTWDSTNVIPTPDVAVIANIGLEHTAILGNTLAEIAGAKCGIIKSGCRAVLYGQSREVETVAEDVCREKNVPLIKTDLSRLSYTSSELAGQRFSYRNRGDLFLSLPGEYQLRNAALVLDTADSLRQCGWVISEKAIAQGLQCVRWPGRMELLSAHPIFLVDGGHNPQCAESLAESLGKLFPGKKLIFIISVLADKNWQQMLSDMLPLAQRVYTVTADSSRALHGAELADYIRQQGVPAEAMVDLSHAVDAALTAAAPQDVICAWGSLYSVGELRHIFKKC